MAAHLQICGNSDINFSCYCSKTSSTPHLPPFVTSLPNSGTLKTKSWKAIKPLFSNQSDFPPQKIESLSDNVSGNGRDEMGRKRRVLFLDVNPLCYKGSTPSLQSFAHWIPLFFSQVSLSDPVIAVLDGERGNDYRRQLLPSYKMNRRKLLRAVERPSRSPFGRSHKLVVEFLQKCNVPVVKIEEHEADDVVATLVEQVLLRGYQAVIASPDKDFKQLISEDVQMVMPLPE